MRPTNHTSNSSTRRNRSSSNDRSHAFPNERKDVTRNSSFKDPKGNLKITVAMIIPNYLVQYLFGKNNEYAKELCSKTGSNISVYKENDVSINTVEGIKGRVITFRGSPKANAEAMTIVQDKIIDLELKINGTKYERHDQKKDIMLFVR
eukprot:TRINITY_DN3020_c0_g1_i3.p4 TRINITY_DN3020_c0_g1~~TRINITY_DN3020_c0_g1_i3.p4  ORF type:complete len:149 (-),score=28.05 TRINITY_DN3020_c0_g1_i3:176-622(-)